MGEIFDLLLLDDEHHALATIETKTPYHNASAMERKDFESRLSGFPTLRTAYFTNGPEWDRLDVFVSNGQLSTLDRSRLDIRKDTPAVAELFFAPLVYESENSVAVGQVYHVNRDNAFIKTTLTRLAADLDQVVGDFKEFYRRLFYGLREGSAGVAAQQVTLAVYEQWCGKSLRVTPRLATQNLISLFKHEGANPLNIRRALSALGLDAPHVATVAESIMSLAPTRREDTSVLIETLWPAFAVSVDQLCAQSAHVTLARALLYRVGEDEGVFERKISSDALTSELAEPTTTFIGRRFRATELLEAVRSEMQSFLPTVYLRGEFDWWAVLPEKRALLTPGQLNWLRDLDEEMEKLSRILLRRLSNYLFESVDVDIWRNIYEHYLPEEERQRLGGFWRSPRRVLTGDQLTLPQVTLPTAQQEREGE